MKTMSAQRPRLLVLYHFFHPDPVVSARIFSDFAAEQAARGWDVTALTSNRSHGDPEASLPAEELWNGVRIRRVFRPAWSQKKPLSRIGNSAWLLPAWLAESAKLGRFDAIVIGSDPSFAASIAIPLRAARPRTPIIHWCLDVYPEAVAAEWTGRTRLLVPPARALMSAAYRRCDVIVDLGPCMRERLERYGGTARHETFTPWALVEPERPADPDPAVRRELFGEAKLGLLYAGSMSRPHDFEGLLALARACRARAGDEIAMCFACTGTNLPRLEAATRPDDTNVRFIPFAEEETIGARFAAADFHLGSLRPEYTGVVVPSKFFAALAAARPFIFAGEPEAAIARWIREHDVGLVLAPGRVDEVADRLVAIKDDPSSVRAMRANALATYRRHFSRRIVNDRWTALLQQQLERRSASPTGASVGGTGTL
jgi:glycosyltransferase involved in cell wall biosynthesis